MTKEIQVYMLTVFNCSYQALQEWKEVNEDYPKWVKWHHSFSGRINRAFIKCYRDSVKSWPKIKDEVLNQQDLVDLLHKILQEHLKYRFEIYKKNKKLTKKTFIFKSVVKSYSLLAVNLVRSIKCLAKCYTMSGASHGKTAVIAKNFPSHGFSISTKKQKISCSFGDYLKNRFNQKRISIFSIDEYKRPSRAKEHRTETGILQIKTSGVKELKRKVIKSKMSVFSFFLWLASLLNYLIWETKQFKWKYDLWFLSIRRYCCSKPLLELCKLLKANKVSIKQTYFLGFSDAIEIPIHLIPNPIEYIYAANVYNPPRNERKGIYSNAKKKKKYKLNEMTLSTLTLSHSAAGFSYLPKEINNLKTIINRTCNLALPVANLRCESFSPTNLGFESEDTIPKIKNTSGIIAVFDTPPDSRESQIQRSIFGDLTHDFFVVKQFLEDIVKVASALGFVIFHKPKYSLENYITQYRSLLEGLKIQYKSSYFHASPYSSVAPLLNNCDASFSFIGSSTHAISSKIFSNSFVYIPNCIRFLAKYKSKNIIVGKSKLKTKLNKIRK